MQGSSLQWKSYLGWTPLHFAAIQVRPLSHARYTGASTAVTTQLATVPEPGACGRTHTHTHESTVPTPDSVIQGDLDLVDWLLEEGADALTTGEDGCMPGDCASNAAVRKTLYKTGWAPHLCARVRSRAQSPCQIQQSLAVGHLGAEYCSACAAFPGHVNRKHVPIAPFILLRSSWLPWRHMDDCRIGQNRLRDATRSSGRLCLRPSL